MRKNIYKKAMYVVCALLLGVAITSCGPSAEQKAKMAEDCKTTGIESSEACKSCCSKAGFSGHSWMSGFMSGGKATCECM